MSAETPSNPSDQRRLHVAHVTIEFDFAFVALPEDAGEVACHLIDQAAGDLSSLHDFAGVRVDLAAPAYEMPLGGCDDDAVCGWSVKWRDAVENDKRLRAADAIEPGPHVCTGCIGDGPCELDVGKDRDEWCAGCGSGRDEMCRPGCPILRDAAEDNDAR